MHTKLLQCRCETKATRLFRVLFRRTNRVNSAESDVQVEPTAE